MDGSCFRSDWADNGFMPAWNATCEGAASHPNVTHLRICIYHRRLTSSILEDKDELMAVEALPLNVLRPGYRVIQLRDAHGCDLQMSKLLLYVDFSRRLLPPPEVRETLQAAERKQRCVSFSAPNEGADGLVFGFAKTKCSVSEAAGTVRLAVRRLKGRDSAALMFYSTEDGTALAGYDYEPQSGHLYFRKGETERLIKVLIIDDDEVEVDKFFSVKLMHPENCHIKKSREKLKVSTPPHPLSPPPPTL